jgi:hypothetical protein
MCDWKSKEARNECNGGAGCCIWRMRDTVGYADKKNHNERSRANDTGQHDKHKPKDSWDSQSGG